MSKTTEYEYPNVDALTVPAAQTNYQGNVVFSHTTVVNQLFNKDIKLKPPILQASIYGGFKDQSIAAYKPFKVVFSVIIDGLDFHYVQNKRVDRFSVVLSTMSPLPPVANSNLSFLFTNGDSQESDWFHLSPPEDSIIIFKEFGNLKFDAGSTGKGSLRLSLFAISDNAKVPVAYVEAGNLSVVGGMEQPSNQRKEEDKLTILEPRNGRLTRSCVRKALEEKLAQKAPSRRRTRGSVRKLPTPATPNRLIKRRRRVSSDTKEAEKDVFQEESPIEPIEPIEPTSPIPTPSSPKEDPEETEYLLLSSPRELPSRSSMEETSMSTFHFGGPRWHIKEQHQLIPIADFPEPASPYMVLLNKVWLKM